MRRLFALHVVSVAGLVPALVACQGSEKTASSPSADCTRIAETLATFELGTSAAADARAPAVAKHRAACESTKVTADEARCLAGAKDTWAARACLPRMFPAPTQTGATVGCSIVATRMREAVRIEVGSAGSSAMAAVEKMLPVIQRSCEEDGWPAPVLDCIGRGKPGDIAAFQACSNQLPKEMQEKAAQRLSAHQSAQPAPEIPEIVETPAAAPPAK